MNKEKFIKDHLKYLNEKQIDSIMEIIQEVAHPKAWRVSIEIDTDMDFNVVDDDGKVHGWDFKEVKYFDTEKDCGDWLKNLANNFTWNYDDKKHTAWMVRDWILEIVENGEHDRCMGGNQTINVSIGKVL